MPNYDKHGHANGYARLDFFYRRSPWHAVRDVGTYPMLRLDAAWLRQLAGATPDL